MNYAIVFRLLGYVLMIEGALLLLPAAASLVYGEWMVLGVFLLTAAVSAGIGYALHTIKPRSKVFYMREGFAATSLCWVFISVIGAVPFVLTGCIPYPVDALFETVSGFTTTGASILPAVEAQLHPLDRRHGCSGVSALAAAADWRLSRQPDESRKPRPAGGQACA